MRNAALTVALLVGLAGSALAQNAGAQTDPSLFPRPPQLTDAIAFWTRVYTEIDSSSGFIHDSRDLGIVYETLQLGPNATSRQRRRATTRATDKYRAILNRLGSGDRGGLTSDEARVLALWPAGTSDDEFKRAAGRLRFQLGQSDRYLAGLKRSGRWKPYIVDVLDSKGLPRELAALPHVESSFDPTAYSKVGAAGLWQFTRSTGLRYMQIDHIIDERRDPFLSTDAAARLLQDNYAVIQSWPLALTAYNHGLAGMRRAVSQQGTSDIGVIVERYTSRTFGFASRNFYAAFLAALDVERDYERYFGELTVDAPESHAVIEVPAYIDAAPLSRALGLPVAELRRLNPALMDSVWGGDKFVPQGFDLRLPGTLSANALELVATVPTAEQYAAQRPDLYHRVRRGETLSGIADQYRVSLAALVRVNGLSNRNFIREGQQITLPIASGETPQNLAAARALAVEGGEYVVRRGDSIDLIARRLGIEQTQLLSANGIADRNRIYVGQVLQVPGERGEAADAKFESPTEPTAATPTEFVAAVVEPAALASTDVNPTTVDFTDAPAGPIDAPDIIVPTVEIDTDPEPDLESNVLASTQASLAADPSDYSVAADDTIEVQDMETLGHYADWLGIRTQRLRDINGMPFRQPVVYGQRIQLDFSKVDPATFEARRLAYQEQRQEAFFSSFHVADLVDHVVSQGESLWLLALRTYDVPVWLLRQYNPDLDLDRVRPGTVVKFPRLRVNGDDEPA